MDDSSKIALGIVGAAVAVFFCWVGYREFERQRDIDEAKAVLAQIAEIPAQMQRESAAAAEAQRRQRTAIQARDMIARTLAADERCIGGTVVRVNGSTYVQAAGSDGRPEVCEGRMRLRAR